MRRFVWPAAATLLAALFVVVPATAPRYIVSLFTLAVITSLLAISVNMLAGEVGLVSMGHAGISATAAYALAWAARQQWDLAAQLGLALLCTLLVSAVYGLTTMRSTGLVFLMITLALGVVVFGLAYKLSTITGGQSGLTGIRRPPALADPYDFYFFCLALTALVLLALRGLARSPFGLMLRGIRDSESRMTSLGYSTSAAKFAAMMVSGLVAGLAGVLGVWNSQFISPSVAGFDKSALAVIMIIIGGVGVPLGPVIGAGLVVGIEHWLSSYVERWPTVLGLLFIGVVILMPGGIAGAIKGTGRTPPHWLPWSAWLGRLTGRGSREPVSTDRAPDADLADIGRRHQEG